LIVPAQSPSTRRCARHLSRLLVAAIVALSLSVFHDASSLALAAPTFYLPWTGGQSWSVTAGNCNDPVANHHCNDPNYYAWDFVPGAGASPLVTAVADGTVCYVQMAAPEDRAKFPGGHAGNVIVIAHEGVCKERTSGLYSQYAHLKPGTASVKSGDEVKRGDPLAQFGSSGSADGAHLHFSIGPSYWTYPQYGYTTSSQRPIRIQFADQSVQADGGRPKTGRTYRADVLQRPNVPPTAPRLVSPQTGQQINPQQSVELEWQDLGDPDNGPAARRTFQVEIKAGATGVITSSWLEATRFELNIPPGTEYRWRVRANDGASDNGISGWSQEWIFAARPVDCATKGDGDANCDTLVDLEDFEQFRREFIAQSNNQRTTSLADFNKDQSVDLLDFEAFRVGFIRTHRRAAAANATPAGLAPSTVSSDGITTFNIFLGATDYNVVPGETLDVDIFASIPVALRLSGVTFVLSYAPDTLAVVSDDASAVSASCAVRGGEELASQLSAVDDPRSGLLRVSRAAIGDEDRLPSGTICLGTVRLRVKDDARTPSTAGIGLHSDLSTWDATGPVAPLAPRLNEATRTARVAVNVVKQPTGLASGDPTAARVTLLWTNNASDARGFHIYARDAEFPWRRIVTVGNYSETPTSERSLTIGGILCNTRTQFQVRAYNDRGESSSAGVIDTQTLPCTVSPHPAPPPRVLADVGRASWTELTPQGEVVFASYRDQHSGLWVVAHAGGVPRLLASTDSTDSRSFVYAIGLARNGRDLVYTARHNGEAGRRLYRVPVEGGQQVQLSGEISPSLEVATNALLSPDRTVVLYSGADLSGSGLQRRLFLAAVDDSFAPRDLTAGLPADLVVYDKQFTPDGRQVLFSAAREGSWNDASLYRCNVGSGACTRIGDAILYALLNGSAVSADSRWVVYSPRSAAPLRAAALDGSTAFDLKTPADAPAGVALAAVSADGRYAVVRRVVFESDVAELYSIALSQGAQPTRLTAPLGHQVQARLIGLSRDGRRVAFAAASERAPSWQVYSVPIEGGELTHLSQTAMGQSFDGHILEDGEHLTFLAGENEPGAQRSLYVAPIDGSRPTTLLDDRMEWRYRTPTSQIVDPTGKWLVYATCEPWGGAFLWAATLSGSERLRLSNEDSRLACDSDLLFPAVGPIHVTPDGRHVVFYSGDPTRAQGRLMTVEITPRQETRALLSDEGGVLETNDGLLRVEVPEGVVGGGVALAYTPLNTASDVAGRAVVHRFTLEARDGEDRPVTTFTKPLTLRIRYDGASISTLGYSESSLILMYERDGIWYSMSGTVDLANDEVLVTLDHLTAFALTAERSALHTFLPLTWRQ
jgi:hypothetical protein